MVKRVEITHYAKYIIQIYAYLCKRQMSPQQYNCLLFKENTSSASKVMNRVVHKQD